MPFHKLSPPAAPVLAEFTAGFHACPPACAEPATKAFAARWAASAAMLIPPKLDARHQSAQAQPRRAWSWPAARPAGLSDWRTLPHGESHHPRGRPRSRLPGRVDCRLCEKFDLIYGTSTGAIIAALLGLGKSVDEVEALYRNHVVTVMGRRLTEP